MIINGRGAEVGGRLSIRGALIAPHSSMLAMGVILEVFGPGSTVQSEGRRRRPEEERTEGAMLHFCLRVTDTEVAYARALAAGAESRVAPRTAVLGQNPLIEVRIAFVTGPEGEVIEFLQSEQI